MLQTLIKRNGSEEPLIPAKLNGWGEWAANHLQGRVDWSQAALAAVAKLPEKATTRELMLVLIEELLAIRTWPAYLMAGRLFATVYRKDIYGSINPPSVFDQHKKLEGLTLMRPLQYSKEEYAEIESLIDHNKDFFYPEFALKQIRDKYAIRNHVTGEVFETPQHLYMRMAMTLAENEDPSVRMQVLRKFYDKFSGKKLSAPTPNYLYLGTPHNGWASCCIFTAADDANSLAIGDHIAYMMTVNSAGLGSFISTRTVGDPIAGGRVMHGGKYRYLKANAAATIANKQAARAGAGTTSFSGFDPEAIDIVQYRNPMQPEDKQLRDLHFSMLVNPWFAAKVQKGEDIFTFTEFSAPDLFDAFFSPDIKRFVELYKQYEDNPLFPKKYVNARKLVLHSYAEAFDTGTAYVQNIHEINRHTPFKISPDHRIHSMNLCQEIAEIQAPYFDMRDLYTEEDHGRGEIAMCNLAAIPIENIGEDDDEYLDACYYALKMIDYTILNGEYPFPHLKFTAHKRMNAGVGIMGLATWMARKGLRYDTLEGKAEIHRIFERHMYFLIKASIKISKERGLAPWIHKTKWPEGWTPLQTYNRNVDKIGKFENVYDWDALSQELIANGGIAHSVLSAMMPGESSSKALGSTNSIYPIRSVVITKTDGENNILRWAAVDGDLLGDAYQSVWDLHYKDLIDLYALGQKWTDQGISADEYRKFAPGETTVTEKEVVERFLYMIASGMKSRYYTNSLRPKVKSMEATVSLVASIPGAAEAAVATEAEANTETKAVISRLQTAALNIPTAIGTDESGGYVRTEGDEAYEIFVKARELFGDTFLVHCCGTVKEEGMLPKGSDRFGDSYLIGESWYVWNSESWIKLYTMPSVEYVESEQEDACGGGACKL
ncbi:putative ribonucleoside-diphosphate reductase [Ralstonia phage RP31]|uniref:Ribonucleoside-diphosphate reductase n=2 Tax=Ripduovirus RP12 TaxID=2560700 RepID=A0A1L7N0Y2_9CAUD|nr:putative ribonucleoside-diphosphate reductase [Ralstonia phage RP12]BAW19130.1 putative ribonucleoside-diphosphate reductase [Ralstonia phage RP12]BAW19416.1 putative ribonucleoside-diphosphate reductase [Ralstonia phage RP31]